MCAPDVDSVLRRAREVLGLVLDMPATSWPSLTEWRRRLPGWLVDAFAPEMTREESAAALAAFRADRSNEPPWTLSGWLYWLHPDQRWWRWWSAEIVSTDKAIIRIEAEDAPFRALTWMFEAAGATVDREG